MKVILTQDFGRDKKGSIVEVNDSFARNHLIKRGICVEATPENLNTLKLQKQHQDKLEQERINKANELREKIDKAVIVIHVKVGKDGKMFGSVTNLNIADEVNKQLNIKIDKKSISGGVLNQLGETSVKIKLHKDITAKLVVKIVGK